MADSLSEDLVHFVPVFLRQLLPDKGLDGACESSAVDSGISTIVPQYLAADCNGHCHRLVYRFAAHADVLKQFPGRVA